MFEKIILKFLQNFENLNNIFIPEQFGFHSEHKTTLQVLRITKSVSLNFNKDSSTGMVLLDIEKAFDSVWNNAILHKLYKFKYSLNIANLIKSFFIKKGNLLFN